MNVKYKLFVGIIIVALGLYVFGASLNYSTVMKSELKAADYFLSNQSTSGAFQIPPYIERIPHMQGPHVLPGSHTLDVPQMTQLLRSETAYILRILYKIGFSANTKSFVKAVNFVTQPSTYTTVSGVPLIGNTQAQMLSDFLWIQSVYGVQLSECAKLARNIIVDNYLSRSYLPLRYVTKLEMTSYNRYQKLQARYLALKIINILPFVETRKLIDLSAANSKKIQTIDKQRIADTLTSMYVVLRKYLMESYVGNGKWLPEISNSHGGTTGISVEALCYLSILKNVIFNVLGKDLNAENEIFKNMKEYGIKQAENMRSVKETIRYIMTSQAADGSWGRITKPLPTPKTIKVGKKELVRYYYEPGLGKVFITSEAITALLRMGIPATNSSIERAVGFLINDQSKDGYWKSKFYPWSDVTVAAMMALREYAKYRWNEKINISKELPSQYSKMEKIDDQKLFRRLGIMYLGILNRLVNEEVSRIH